MKTDEFRAKVEEIKAKRDSPTGELRYAEVWYSNRFEERGKLEGVIRERECFGTDMLSITRDSGRETLLHFSDVERIDYPPRGESSE